MQNNDVHSECLQARNLVALQLSFILTKNLQKVHNDIEMEEGARLLKKGANNSPERHIHEKCHLCLQMSRKSRDMAPRTLQFDDLNRFCHIEKFGRRASHAGSGRSKLSNKSLILIGGRVDYQSRFPRSSGRMLSLVIENSEPGQSLIIIDRFHFRSSFQIDQEPIRRCGLLIMIEIETCEKNWFVPLVGNRYKLRQKTVSEFLSLPVKFNFLMRNSLFHIQCLTLCMHRFLNNTIKAPPAI
jgi:hypothetical protein